MAAPDTPPAGPGPTSEAVPPAAAGTGRPPGPTLIIGYGSPIRGDDAVGPLVADRLAAGPLPAGTEVISRHILTADLVPDIAAAARVVFVDAAAHGAPGEVRCLALSADREVASTMAHFLDPRELLAWADALYDARPEAFLVSVAGAEFGFSHFELSAAVDRALPAVLRTLRDLAGLNSAPQTGPETRPQP